MRTLGFIGLLAVTLTLPHDVLAAAPNVTVGLLSKIIADVSHKGGAADWQPAKKGEPLLAGDRVKTGTKSMAIIKFMDNSLVRVRELTELTVTGTMSGSAFQKSVEMRTGVVGFSVEKQKSSEEFRFTSPTSVASIRGTSGAFEGMPRGDTLVVLEGLVGLKNLRSNKTVDVKAGYTGISLPDGSLFARVSTDDERNRANDALRGDATRTLEFELRDSQGRPQHLKIEYRD